MLHVINQGTWNVEDNSEATQLRKKQSIRFVKARQAVNRSLRESSWSISFTCQNLPPKTLHRLIRNQTAFVKKISDPIIFNVFRLSRVTNIRQCMCNNGFH